ncbi:AfsR/SARP family transcriptional regulator [Micromonospora sonneratiae]|uniref:BTAD domain-containing putative transcriptional regulator n=1 Tax=Micromonospora sonneratiae TaxID=1184706 RepID=A0ABW3YCE8_9ACTN
MPRLLLATLLLHPNQAVHTDVLVDVLWPESPPRSAIANLRTYVSRLRSTVAVVAPDGPRVDLLTRPGGYLLEMDVDQLDLTRFERLAQLAQQARQSHDAATALGHAQAALALWRGRLLEDLPQGVVWTSTAFRLAALRDELVELSADARVETGRYQEAIVELRGLLASDPLHEGWWRGLVLALHGSGRTAEALRVYGEARRVLATELGVEPGPRLRQALTVVLGDRDTASVCQLPMDVVDFTGRTELVSDLVSYLGSATERPHVVALCGSPGAGKSALAIRIGHELREAFPDGQLYVELQGTAGPVRDPAMVLAELLEVLGVASNAIPATFPSRSALFRSKLASRRMLVVLDDAANVSQVRPLLPGAGGCAVLITSRARMPELSGVRMVDVTRLPGQEARQLFARLLGADRLDAPTGGTDEILDACGHLPLAIRIAAARLKEHSDWTPASLAKRLGNERHRLDELRVGDLDVRASITLSYRLLPAAVATAFRRLGQLGAVTVPGWVLRVLRGGLDSDDPVEVMVNANLLQRVGADKLGQSRYQLHDLLRSYAREQGEEDPAEETLAALRRTFDAWLALVSLAGRHLPARFFGVQPRTIGPESPRWPSAIEPALAERVVADPVAWFDCERANLLAAVEIAESAGLDEHAWRIAASLAPYIDLCGHYDDWVRSHECALRSARRVGDSWAEAVLLRNLGQAYLFLDRYPEAAAAFATARELFVRSGDLKGEAVVLCGQGAVHRVGGRLAPALAAQRQALRLFRSVGDFDGEAVVSIAIGRICLARDRVEMAWHWFTNAYELASELGDQHRQAQALHRLAMMHARQSRHEEALALIKQALQMLEEIGDAHCAAYVRQSYGEVYLERGNIAHARALLARSMHVQEQLGDRLAAANIATLLGARQGARDDREAGQLPDREVPSPGAPDRTRADRLASVPAGAVDRRSEPVP